MNPVQELMATPGYRRLCRFQLPDPYPVLRQLREQDPVHWSPELEAWVVTKFELVQQCLRCPGLVNNRTAINMRAIHEPLRPQYRSLEVHVSNWLGFTDPPKHTRMRDIARDVLSPTAAKRQLPTVERLISRRIDLLRDRENVDLLSEFAVPVPLTVVSGILGVPAEDMTEFHRWSAEIAGFAGIMNPLPDDPAMRLTVQRANAAWAEAQGYFTELLAARHRSPRGDGITALASARAAGLLIDDEALGLCIFILAAGHGTTATLISNAILLLLTHRAALVQLQRAPELAPAAVEEILRYEGPIATARGWRQETWKLRAVTSTVTRPWSCTSGPPVVTRVPSRIPTSSISPGHQTITLRSVGEAIFALAPPWPACRRPPCYKRSCEKTCCPIGNWRGSPGGAWVSRTHVSSTS